MANPGKTVIGVTGDGGSMYTIQALWSGARRNVPAKFIICNNRSYRLLQLNVSEYWREIGVAQHEFPLSFDLSKPEIDFAAPLPFTGRGCLTRRDHRPNRPGDS